METLNKVNAETVLRLPPFTQPSTISLVVLRDATKSKHAATPKDLTAPRLIENRLPVGDAYWWDKNRLMPAGDSGR